METLLVAEFQQRRLGPGDIFYCDQNIEVAELAHRRITVQQLSQRWAFVRERRYSRRGEVLGDPREFGRKPQHPVNVFLKSRTNCRLNASGHIIPVAKG